jgi:hypothetical protein
MIVKIFYEYVNQSTSKNVEQDLQKLEDKINMFAGQKRVLIHDIKYEKIQKDQMQQMIIAFVHRTYKSGFNRLLRIIEPLFKFLLLYTCYDKSSIVFSKTYLL